jgi:hypothetical protein
MSVEVDVLVDVWVGVGAGAGAPGESIIPADADTARTQVTIATAHVRRNLFISTSDSSLFCDPQKHTKIFATNPNFVLAGVKKLR